MKAHDYIRKVGERDKAELDLRQCQELLRLGTGTGADKPAKGAGTGDRELKEDLPLIQQNSYLLDQPLYQEVKHTFLQESTLNRTSKLGAGFGGCSAKSKKAGSTWKIG